MAIHATCIRLALLAGSAFLQILSALPALAREAPVDPKLQYKPVLEREAASRALCEQRSNRVHVTHKLGSECIAYYVTTELNPGQPTVLFLDGDVTLADFHTPGYEDKSVAATMSALQRFSDKFRVRYVFVARPGLFGSSGNHGSRRRPAEMATMNAAVDAIKARLGIKEFSIAGQSGGSTVGASLLASGRRDIACAVLGSGGFDTVEGTRSWAAQSGKPMPSVEAVRRVLYEPFANLPKIVAAPARRVMVLGDPTDKRTPYFQQARYARELADRGHNAVAVEVAGRGDLNHGVAHLALPAAAQCAHGDKDETIARIAKAVPRPLPVVPAPKPLAGATTGAVR